MLAFLENTMSFYAYGKIGARIFAESTVVEDVGYNYSEFWYIEFQEERCLASLFLQFCYKEAVAFMGVRIKSLTSFHSSEPRQTELGVYFHE